MNKTTFYLTFIFALLALIVYSLLRIYYLKGGYEYGVDAFYHVRMAEFFPSVCFEKTFPWTQLSIWKTNFYDKELGFHALLSGFIYIQNILGLKTAAPFNFLNISTLTIFIVIVIIGINKLKLKTGFIAVPLLLFISPLFLLRLNMIRPHTISISLFLLIIFILISNLRYREKIFSLFLLSWLYTISYSVPHIIFIPLIGYCTAAYYVKKHSNITIKKTFFLFLIVILGISAGLILHPQFPNSVYCWYIQGFMVVKKILGYNIGQVGLGLELLAPTGKTIIENISVFLLLLTNTVFIILLKEKRKNVQLITFFFIQIIMTVGFYFSERCIEYAVPSAVICFVIALDKLLARLNVKYLVCNVICFLIIILVFTSSLQLNKDYLKSSQFTPCNSFSDWAPKNIKPGAYIGQIRWGEFPRLFYPAPQFRYSMAMDPMFSYFVFPKKTVRLERFRMLIEPIPPKELKEILGTDLVFISKNDPVPANYLIKSGAKVIYHGNDGWLFLL